jgi:hypothetical protein
MMSRLFLIALFTLFRIASAVAWKVSTLDPSYEYILVDEVNFEEAKQQCANQERSSVLKVVSEREIGFIKSNYLSVAVPQVWLNAKKLESNSSIFNWLDDMTEVTGIANAGTKRKIPDGRCLALDVDTIFSVNCDAKLAVICERKVADVKGQDSHRNTLLIAVLSAAACVTFGLLFGCLIFTIFRRIVLNTEVDDESYI